MSGAAVLCGSGAIRGGAGLVRVATPAEVLPIVASANPCYLTAPLAADAAGQVSTAAVDQVLTLAAKADVLALGPGLGLSDETARFVEQLLDRIAPPVVLDADGLNALARLLAEGWNQAKRQSSSALVLTPHPGEFARLTQSSTAGVLERRDELAAEFAARQGVVLVLKGQGTLVTDGHRLYRNTTGNPGMATGGTGDVLTGLIAAFVAQGLEPFAAAQLGVYAHGLAGDLAAEAVGEVPLIATDLLDYLPRALDRVVGHGQPFGFA
jgi:NAD(P)H-hydrate epimerase